jgi:ligand-binding sensor domain-containing protein/signal transduction histidine kinase/DNA-binding response OmpR family regulator
MKFILPFIVYLLLIQSVYSIQAQYLDFKHIGVKDGLANGTVQSIAQDSKGFMWFGTANGLNRYDTQSFKTYRTNPNNPKSISSDLVYTVIVDSKGILWVGTDDGLNKYDPMTDSFEKYFHDPDDQSSLSHSQIRNLMEDRNGNLWVGTSQGLNRMSHVNGKEVITRFMFEAVLDPKQTPIVDLYEDHQGILWASIGNGIVRIDPKKTSPVYQVYYFNKIKNVLDKPRITRLCGDRNGNIWIASTYEGLGKFEPKSGQFNWIPWKKSILGVWNMKADHSGKIWVATSQGVCNYNPTNQTFASYNYDPVNEKTLRDDYTTDVFEDRQGNIWVGTYSGGVSYAWALPSPFTKLSFDHEGTHLNRIIGDSIGNVMLVSDRNGFYSLAAHQTQFTALPFSGQNKLKVYDAYYHCSGRIWITNESGMLLLFKRQEGKVIEMARFEVLDNKSSFYLDHLAKTIREDRNGKVWIGTFTNGLFLFDWNSGKVEHFNTDLKSKFRLQDNQISYLFEDSKQNMWIGMRSGVHLWKKDSNELLWFDTYPNRKEYETKGAVEYIQEDQQGRIWIGSFYAGLMLFDSKNQNFVPVKDLENLPDNNISNIQVDQSGYLWFSNDLGLVRYHPDKKTIQEYHFSDGLPGSEIITGGSYKSPSGEMFFATNTGAFRFNPAQVPINDQPPSVAFTGLKVFNKPVDTAGDNNLFHTDISYIKQLTLNHKQSTFTVDFAVLNFVKSDRNQYAYKLKGFEDDWNYVKIPSITYTNIPSGNYTLLVKGANNDGIWSTENTELQITILPPWWKSWYALLAYLILFVSVLFFLIRFFWLRISFQKEVQLQQDKLDFFNNISHEIRTHLTLINGPVEILLNKRKEDKEIQNHLKLAKNTSDRLLNLVGELMDFRKLESGAIQLHVYPHDLIPFLKNILGAFHHFAESKAILSHFSSNTESVLLWFDADQLQKVVYNLLMNAYKFTPKGGSVNLSVIESEDHVEIKVSDNGKGIAPEHLSKLFVNYYQVYDYGQQNTGYGLGLALVKQIVGLHQGEVTVTSQMAKQGKMGNTVFTTILFKGNAHFPAHFLPNSLPDTEVEPHEELLVQHEILPVNSDEKNIILLVEDNEELRFFIRNALKETYQIVEAKNGLEGWAWAIENIPDLVISDIMMGEMDGLELCRKLKADDRTSHVPVILLSAKATISQQIEGLETGADSYVTKPFSMEILQSKIKNLFRVRETMQLKYNRQLNLGSQKIEVTNRDQKFLSEIIAYIEANMEDQNLGILELSKNIGMSKSALYRKLKAMTQMTTNDFVNMIRLERAAQLLNQRQMSVNEVANRVGFESRKYFSKLFKQRFGKTPREYSGQVGIEDE